jgi:tripartite-type tricarboxylate transporter receptor subunit TctC
MVTGYESAQEDLAVERGEIDGRTNSAESILRSKPEWISKNFAPILVMNGPERDPQVPDVPTVYEYNKNPGAFFETINEGLSVARPYVLSPGTPADRVATLRKAWQDMLADPSFIEEVKRLKFNYVPTSGEKLDAFYRKVVTSTSPDVIASLKEIFP